MTRKPLELPAAVARAYNPTERSTAPHDGRGSVVRGRARPKVRTSSNLRLVMLTYALRRFGVTVIRNG
jgi:hypothetical protein